MTDSNELNQDEKGNEMRETQFSDAETYPNAETLNTDEAAKAAGSSASPSDNSGGENIGKFAPPNQPHKEAVYKAVDDLKIGSEEGEVEVTKDPLIIKDGIDFSGRKLIVRPEYLKCVLCEEAITQWYYVGGLVALEWMVGHHNEELANSLTSDGFNLMFDIPQGLWLAEAEKVATRALKDGDVLWRARKQIEEERKLLRKLLDVFAARPLKALECVKALRVAGAFSALELYLSGEIVNLLPIWYLEKLATKRAQSDAIDSEPVKNTFH